MEVATRDKQIVVATIDRQIEETFSKDMTNGRFHIRFLRKGSDILLTILEEDIDLLIVDLEVAGIEGIDLIPIIRKSRPRLPLIVISKDFNYQIRQMVAQEGVTYQIFKPLSAKELSEVVQTAHGLLQGA
jgi:two-component system nitrogen regulation response regulator GlnG